jgi:hypothetical protein
MRSWSTHDRKDLSRRWLVVAGWASATDAGEHRSVASCARPGGSVRIRRCCRCAGAAKSECIDYLDALGIETPKSACVYCPYHSDAAWRSLTDADLARAVEVEDALAENFAAGTGFVSQMRSLPTLHPSGIPLRDRPFDHGDNSGAMDTNAPASVESDL